MENKIKMELAEAMENIPIEQGNIFSIVRNIWGEKKFINGEIGTCKMYVNTLFHVRVGDDEHFHKTNNQWQDRVILIYPRYGEHTSWVTDHFMEYVEKLLLINGYKEEAWSESLVTLAEQMKAPALKLVKPVEDCEKCKGMGEHTSSSTLDMYLVASMIDHKPRVIFYANPSVVEVNDRHLSYEYALIPNQIASHVVHGIIEMVKWAEDADSCVKCFTIAHKSRECLEEYILGYEQNEGRFDVYNRDKLFFYPYVETVGAAGINLFNLENVVVPVGGRVVVNTNVKIISYPPGTYAQVMPRWSTASIGPLYLHPGVIDRDYNGELKLCYWNFGDSPITLQPNEAYAQLVFLRYCQLNGNAFNKRVAK